MKGRPIQVPMNPHHEPPYNLECKLKLPNGDIEVWFGHVVKRITVDGKRFDVFLPQRRVEKMAKGFVIPITFKDN